MHTALIRRRRRMAAPFSPASLFANGEQGAWYEPSPTTCFTDTAGTTPAGVGDAVARINDLSGNGNHATQATSGARPILRQSGGLYYLEFDGTNDCFVTSSIDFTGTDKMTICAGLDKESNSITILAELSATIGSNARAFYLVAGEDLSSRYSSMSRGDFGASGGRIAKFTASGYAPDTAVITATHDISGDLSTIRRNGVAGASATEDKGPGNFGSYPLFIGARNQSSLFFDGNLYSMVIRGAETADVSDLEAHVAAKTGVTL